MINPICVAILRLGNVDSWAGTIHDAEGSTINSADVVITSYR